MQQKTVVFISGASSGLGKATALHLHNKGYIVYGSSRNALRHQDLPFGMLSMDVHDAQSISKAIENIILQEGRLDVLINNAGIGIAGPLETLPLSSIEKVFSTNVFGLVQLTQAALPYLRESKGKILNVSSIGSEVALPYRSVYSASKAATDRLTEALRMEVATFGVQASSLLFGDIQTNINDHRLMEAPPADSVYAATYQKAATTMNEEVGQGVTPEFLAEKIETILRKQKLKKRYLLGKPLQKVSVFLKGVLPGTWFEQLILNYSGTK